MPCLTNILTTCNFVTAHARHVHLNRKNLAAFAGTLTSPPEHWLTTNPHNLLSLPLPLLTTILLYFEVIDYSFWPSPTHKKWTVLTSHGPLDGSIALIYLLIINFQQNPALDFSTFSDADFYNFFQPIASNHSISRASTISPNRPAPSTSAKIPLLANRAQTLRETSRILRKQLNNDFYAAIKNFTTDEQLFHFLITTFPSFRDQRIYIPTPPTRTAKRPSRSTATPATIHFYKLAQLLTSDLLFVRHHLENIPVDTKNLPGCADYKIPQTLRALNLVSYDEKLTSLVDTQRLIPKNSPYEVELRAATISAIDVLHQLRPEFSPIQINDYLFLASRNLKKKPPYHLTRNTNY